MRVLIIDADHCGLDFALRAASYGHEVKLFRFSKKPTRYAEGFKQITLVSNWRDHMGWAKDGLVLLTANNRYVGELDRYRDIGFGQTIFGPSVASAKLEIERSAGMDAMRSIGIDLPAFETFDGLADAEAFARKSDRAWCFKPMGDEEDKSLTYVAKDPADLVGWLQRQQKAGKKMAGRAMLQEKVDRLCELGVSGWMGPEGFLPDKWQLCWEHKPLMDGDVGPATGEQGSVCQYVDEDKMAEEMLKPLEPALRALGHRGDTSINCIIDKKGKAHFLEFTMRCGYPAWWIQTASHRGDPVIWMKDLLRGEDSLKVTYDAAIGVVMAHPDYPFDNFTPEQTTGIPMRGVDAVLPDLHLVEVMMGKGPVMKGDQVIDAPVYLTAGTYPAVATATGKTVTKARERVYKTVKSLHWPNIMYRSDIGVKVIEKLPQVQKFGYATQMRA